MAIAEIQNGEAASSVRTKLNSVIGVVNSRGLIAAEAAVNVSAGQAVYITAASLAALASATTLVASHVAGLVAADTVSGVAAEIKRDTLTLADWTAVTGTTNLTPGAVYYLSTTTPGALTTTAPDSTDNVLVRVGVASAADTLSIQIGTPIIL